MALNRIKLRAGDAGAGTPLAINPIEVDFVDSYDQSIIETLDGESVIHQAVFDARQRQLIWRGINTDNTVFEAQLGTLKKFLHKIVYVSYQDVDTRIHVTDTWNKYRVQDIIVTMRPTGRLKYDEVKMILLPAKT